VDELLYADDLIPTQVFLSLVDPFFVELTRAAEQVYVTRITERVFEGLLRKPARKAQSSKPNIRNRFLSIVQALSQRLFEVASSKKDIRNRKVFYSLRSDFEKFLPTALQSIAEESPEEQATIGRKLPLWSSEDDEGGEQDRQQEVQNDVPDNQPTSLPSEGMNGNEEAQPTSDSPKVSEVKKKKRKSAKKKNQIAKSQSANGKEESQSSKKRKAEEGSGDITPEEVAESIPVSVPTSANNKSSKKMKLVEKTTNNIEVANGLLGEELVHSNDNLLQKKRTKRSVKPVQSNEASPSAQTPPFDPRPKRVRFSLESNKIKEFLNTEVISTSPIRLTPSKSPNKRLLKTTPKKHIAKAADYFE